MGPCPLEATTLDQRLVGIDFGLPAKTAAQGYLIMHYNVAISFAGIISQVQSNADPRIRNFTLFAISLIPDEFKRADAKKRLDEQIKEIMGNAKESMDIKHMKINEACLDMYGHLWSYLDEFIGIERRLKVGEIGEPFKEDEVEDGLTEGVVEE